MGIFTELAILYSKYKPAKCEFRQHNSTWSFNVFSSSNGAFEAICCPHQHTKGAALVTSHVFSDKHCEGDQSCGKGTSVARIGLPILQIRRIRM
jgi:hypothetical protein